MTGRIDTKTPGIHHITAIAGDPQKNLEFYSGLIGLRLVKMTVNFDDPGTYHLYYGDGSGNPGTILTFFPWPGAQRGRQGTGQASSLAFAIPPSSLGYWIGRLVQHGVNYRGPPNASASRSCLCGIRMGCKLTWWRTCPPLRGLTCLLAGVMYPKSTRFGVFTR